MAEIVRGDAVRRRRVVLARRLRGRARDAAREDELAVRDGDISVRRQPDDLRRLDPAGIGGVAVVGVGRIDVSVRRKIRIEGEAEQAAIMVVVHVRDDVERRRQQRAVLEHFYRPVFERDEDAPIGSEHEGSRGVVGGAEGRRQAADEYVGYEAAEIGPVRQAELHHRTASVFVVLDNDGMQASGHLLVGGMRDAALIDPEVQDQLAIDIDA